MGLHQIATGILQGRQLKTEGAEPLDEDLTMLMPIEKMTLTGVCVLHYATQVVYYQTNIEAHKKNRARYSGVMPA